jgi:hypothetical protein
MISTLVISILSLLLIISSYFCLKFAIIIIDVQESMEDCIEIMDEKQASIEEILTRPLFFDSREVRQVLSDIKSSREAIIDVADKLKFIVDEEDHVDSAAGDNV